MYVLHTISDSRSLMPWLVDGWVVILPINFAKTAPLAIACSLSHMDKAGGEFKPNFCPSGGLQLMFLNFHAQLPLLFRLMSDVKLSSSDFYSVCQSARWGGGGISGPMSFPDGWWVSLEPGPFQGVGMSGGMPGVGVDMFRWDGYPSTLRHGIPWDTVGKRVVHILMEFCRR